MRIGLDLDNTIICYDQAFAQVARELGLLDRDDVEGKEAVKEALIAERGMESWMRLQGQVYGPLIGRATGFAGVAEFVAAAGRRGWSLEILSHKTEFGHFDETRTDLRKAAMSWLGGQAWFKPGFPVTFFDSLDDKVEAIRAGAFDAFVDDLPKVLTHPRFPGSTRRIWFSPAGADMGDFEGIRAWADLEATLGRA